MRTNGYTERARSGEELADAGDCGGIPQRRAHGRPSLQFVRVAALISTLVMASTSLSASHKLPSGPTTMWRTTPPPDGRIGHVWNFSVAGSNRTSMFGLALPSTYQTIVPEAVMAYGCERTPLGDVHSF